MVPRVAANNGTHSPAAIRLRWNRVSSAPCEMYRWCDAVAGEGRIYFRRAGLNNLHINYSYSIADRCWELLPRCPLGHPTLVVIDGQLTAIGDKNPLSNQLSTLQGRPRHSQQWMTVYPPMPTRRYLTTALWSTEETALVVAGGVGEENRVLTIVELMHRENGQWSTAASLPLPLTRCSVTLLDERIYLLGGLTVNESSRRVLSCSLRRLLDSASNRGDTSRRARNVWNTLADLPVYDSTCVSFRGFLLAVGGRDEWHIPTTAVRIYIPARNMWEVVGHMGQRRYQCFAIVVPNSCQIMVVGGTVRRYPRFVCTNEVEVTD